MSSPLDTAYGGFEALDSWVDGEENSSRCCEQSPVGRWRQGEGAAAVRVQRAALGAATLHELVRHASLFRWAGSSFQIEPETCEVTEVGHVTFEASPL